MAKEKKNPIKRQEPETFTMNFHIKPDRNRLMKKTLEDMELKEFKPEEVKKEDLN